MYMISSWEYKTKEISHTCSILYCSPGEIDRCHKKVTEGVDAFQETWKKVGLT